MIWVLLVVMFDGMSVGQPEGPDEAYSYVLGQYATDESCRTAAMNFGYQASAQYSDAPIGIAAMCVAASDPSTAEKN